MTNTIRNLNIFIQFSILVICLGVSLSASAQVDNPSCDALKSLVTESVNNTPSTVSVAQQFAASLSDEVRAVFIGESHLDMEAVVHEAEIVTALQTRGFDCLFIEMPEGFGVLSDLKTTDKGIERGLKDLKSLSDAYDYLPNVLERGWFQAALKAKQAGMKVFEFDQRPHNDNMSDIVNRNATMTRNLIKNLNGKQCHKAITLNGYWHTVIDTKSGKLQSLPAQAEKNGIASHTLIIQSRSFEKSSPLLTKTCDYTAIGDNKPYLIKNKSDISDLFQESLSDLAKDYEEEFKPIMLDGTRSIIIY